MKNLWSHTVCVEFNDDATWHDKSYCTTISFTTSSPNKSYPIKPFPKNICRIESVRHGSWHPISVASAACGTLSSEEEAILGPNGGNNDKDWTGVYFEKFQLEKGVQYRAHTSKSRGLLESPTWREIILDACSALLPRQSVGRRGLLRQPLGAAQGFLGRDLLRRRVHGPGPPCRRGHTERRIYY